MKVHVALTSPQQHERSLMPKALHDLYYRGRESDCLLNLIDSNGYPHNGGQHTLTVNGDRADVVAWLDLFKEKYPGVDEEIDKIKAEIRKEFIRDPNKQLLFVKLAEIKRQHPHNGELVLKPWFWTPHWEESHA